MAHERRVVVFGAGAVGGYLGGRLALGSERTTVSLIGRAATRDAIDAHGLTILEGDQRTSASVRALTAGDAESADLVLLTVRTHDLPAAIPAAARLLTPGALVVGFQNGVGSDELLTEAFGADRVVAGTLTVAVRSTTPGTVARIGDSGGIALAPLSRELPAWLPALFATTGLPLACLPDTRSLRWSKLLLNMLGAASSAILDVDMRTVVGDPRVFGVERAAFLEATRVMDALGVRTRALPGYPVPLVRRAMQLPQPLPRLVLGRSLAQSRAGESPMMRSELARGRTEVAAMHGAVAATATSVGVMAPVNAALASLVELLAANPAVRAVYHENPEALLAYLAGSGARV
jgi:2-dehydropantoate 2-reductase